jgi:tetratricopeptide (TPR) repeat protein
MKTTEKIHELLKKGWEQRGSGNYKEASVILEEAKKICKKDDFESLGRIQHILMQFQADKDNFSEAQKFSKISLEYYKKSGNAIKIAHSQRHLADLQRELGMFRDSESNYRESIKIYLDNSDKTPLLDLANALRGFGVLLSSVKMDVEAKTIWAQVKSMYAKLNLPEGVSEADQYLNKE